MLSTSTFSQTMTLMSHPCKVLRPSIKSMQDPPGHCAASPEAQSHTNCSSRASSFTEARQLPHGQENSLLPLFSGEYSNLSRKSSSEWICAPLTGMAKLAEAIFLHAVLRSSSSRTIRSPIATRHAADSRPGLAATLKSTLIAVGGKPRQDSLTKSGTAAKSPPKSSPHLI